MSSNRRAYLELRVSMGVLTDAEREELERLRADRNVTYLTTGGVLVSALREYTVAEWKELVARSKGQNRPLLAPEERKSE